MQEGLFWFLYAYIQRMGKIPLKYKIEIRVLPQHLDELRHVNNVVYFEFLQQVAIEHWYGKAPVEVAEKIRWVVRKHEIEYLKPAFEGDLLQVITWVDEFTQVSSRRYYEIYRGKELLVKASTLWIALDAESMKPVRIPISVAESFFESDQA